VKCRRIFALAGINFDVILHFSIQINNNIFGNKFRQGFTHD